MPDALETFLTELRDIHRSGAGVRETSYYGPLANLLNEVGKGLKPRVRCIINITNQGAGLPDGGLFTPDQFPRGKDAQPLSGQPPSRGAIEVKGPGEDLQDPGVWQQVSRYAERYGQVLFTNLRSFALVEHGPGDATTVLEQYRLADSEAALWSAVNVPRKTAQEHGEALSDYLQRVMLQAAPLTAPEDVAWFLASYARDARTRVEGSDLPALDNLRTALQDALGLTFEGEKGDHFFRSTLVQTLFYGVFSAWVLWSKQRATGFQPVGGGGEAGAGATATTGRMPVPQERFNWHEAGWSLHVPMIRALFEQIATPTHLRPLGLVEVLDWAAATLNRVDRGAFFDRFEEEHAVQYFYEPFLKAFDPELRKELGVWYTPPEIVQYMVARVDTVLREELDIPDGLADPRVYVLDPCCGTGAYLVAVIQRISETLARRRGDALDAHAVKQAATSRVFGFEILPAPFVVAHLQIGLLLRNLGAPLDEDHDERAAVYLTNALTGWEPPQGAKQHLLFAEMEAERDAADKVKRDKHILVILGNPPYNGFAGVAVDEERDLSNAYRTTKLAPAPLGHGLNDLYVRFFRMAERRIVEMSGEGVLCFISNYSWLTGPSFTGMRERYLEAFDRMWVDCLNGDKYKTGKQTPWGTPDPSVFSTRGSPIGIQVGTAISLLVRQPDGGGVGAQVRFRHLWGTDKLEQLLAAAEQEGVSPYEELDPPLELGLPLMPATADEDYLTWPLLPELWRQSYSGVMTSRDDLVVDKDRESLARRMEAYFSADVDDQQISEMSPRAMQDSQGFQARAARRYLVARGQMPQSIQRYAYRPLDSRWLFWEPDVGLLHRGVPSYRDQVRDANVWLFTTGRTRKSGVGPALCTRLLSDLNLMDSGSRAFPLYLHQQGAALLPWEEIDPEPVANTTRASVSYLSRTGGEAGDLFHHCVAVHHSPAYLRENADGIRQDWPRIPLPAGREALLHSAALGRQVAALLDTESPVPGITTGTIRAELRPLGLVSRAGGGSLDPGAGELAVTAGWGHIQQGGTMPGAGRLVPRAYTPEETAAIEEGVTALDLTPEVALAQLGERTCDVYLNDVAYWRNVPEKVWGYTIGGYQVVKKWLSYRERDLLGRDLLPDEARYVTEMVRRIAAILLLQPALDANYEVVKADTYRWADAVTKR